MRAITLHQPWASLVAIGAKRIETRSWATSYRGPLAIHAGKSREGLYLCQAEMVRRLLVDAGLDPDYLPLGAVVCSTRLLDCIQTDVINGITEQERALGNYDPQRFGWMLDRVDRFHPSIPARGAQGLWEWCPAFRLGTVHESEALEEDRLVDAIPQERDRD